MSVSTTEDKLVQETVANYFRDQLGWNSVYAYNSETFGETGTLGRASDRDIVLERHLRQALEKFNVGLPAAAYDDAVRKVRETMVSQSWLQINKDKYSLLKNGVEVSFRNAAGQIEKPRLRIFDFATPTNNDFLVVRELWVRGSLYRRRPDIIGFVNGLPLLFIELKNVHKDIRHAYDDNLSDYKDTIPHIFHFNAVVVLSNGDKAKIGSLSSKFEHFHEWKRLSETATGTVDMETLLKGLCSKQNFMDIFENFILFDDSTGPLVKILAKNHQFLGVNKAVEAVRTREERQGQLGVFWHTQGSGKSYSMVFFAQKVHRKLTGNFTFLIVTDREDLDRQIYKTFTGTGAVAQETRRAASGQNLKDLFDTDQAYIFTMIHKFNKYVDPTNPYSNRSDIIVISDEAHRTQYGKLALNMRNALPNANYIGFTGTPLFTNDEITKRIFGEYVSTYDFQRAVEDGATVPLYYDSRGEKLGLTTDEINAKIAAKLEEIELDPDQQARLERELAREYHIITAEKRLQAIAKDFTEHYACRWESGKAMFVCIDKITAVRMLEYIRDYWLAKIRELEQTCGRAKDEQEEIFLQRQLAWMRETEFAVVISEEQGEVQRFKDWGIDIQPYRRKLKEGYETPDGRRIDMETAFKRPEHPFRVAIVCAMWLTGFDVQSLATLYLDKPLQAHTLMQAIARANRVYEGKNNGLIVDYCGILKQLRKALATFAVGGEGGGGGGVDPVKPEEELLAELTEAISLVETYLGEKGAGLNGILHSTGFERIGAINAVKDAINENDETRKRFEVLAREVFKKFKACLTIKAVNRYHDKQAAIDLVYKKLQEDRAQADIHQVLQELHAILDHAVTPVANQVADGRLYDISKIDFELLRQEFKRMPHRNTAVQQLREALEQRLQQMLRHNPLRVDYYERYQQIVAEYNSEKERATIEATFEALMKFCADLNTEEQRKIREGISEEYLAVFDILTSGKTLAPKQRDYVKKIGMDLLDHLKNEKLKIDNWRDKDATQAEVRAYIHDYLYDDRTGLPVEFYSEDEVQERATLVFQHVYMQYPDVEHSAYAM